MKETEKSLFMHHASMSLVIILLSILVLFGFSNCYEHIIKTETNTEVLMNAYHKEVEENEILWSYIENVDTFKSLEDAIRYRDDLIEQLQFLDE